MAVMYNRLEELLESVHKYQLNSAESLSLDFILTLLDKDLVLAYPNHTHYLKIQETYSLVCKINRVDTGDPLFNKNCLEYHILVFYEDQQRYSTIALHTRYGLDWSIIKVPYVQIE